MSRPVIRQLARALLWFAAPLLSAPAVACGFHAFGYGQFGGHAGYFAGAVTQGDDPQPDFTPEAALPPTRAQAMEQQRTLFLARYPSLRAVAEANSADDAGTEALSRN